MADPSQYANQPPDQASAYGPPVTPVDVLRSLNFSRRGPDSATPDPGMTAGTDTRRGYNTIEQIRRENDVSRLNKGRVDNFPTDSSAWKPY